MNVKDLLNPYWNNKSAYQKQSKKGQRSASSCQVCKKEFHDASTALRHYKHVHTKPSNCPYCDKSLRLYGRPDVLKNHYMKCKMVRKCIGGNDVLELAKIDYYRIKKDK
eukprot:NODE_544_length_6876_cov_0.251439.p6 type:complete len:109 gc:universal NODE_544_length_6876_cov_0.251439:475-801(+)